MEQRSRDEHEEDVSIALSMSHPSSRIIFQTTTTFTGDHRVCLKTFAGQASDFHVNSALQLAEKFGCSRDPQRSLWGRHAQS
jgi:hypothetical protein